MKDEIVVAFLLKYLLKLFVGPLKLLVSVLLTTFLALPASAQVRLMSLYNITPERAELILDTPFDTLQNNPNDIILLYRNFNGIYKISYWLNKAEAVELTPHDK